MEQECKISFIDRCYSTNLTRQANPSMPGLVDWLQMIESKHHKRCILELRKLYISWSKWSEIKKS